MECAVPLVRDFVVLHVSSGTRRKLHDSALRYHERDHGFPSPCKTHERITTEIATSLQFREIRVSPLDLLTRLIQYFEQRSSGINLTPDHSAYPCKAGQECQTGDQR